MIAIAQLRSALEWHWSTLISGSRDSGLTPPALATPDLTYNVSSERMPGRNDKQGGSNAFDQHEPDGGGRHGGDVVAHAGRLHGQGSGQLPRGRPNRGAERDADPRRRVQPRGAADQGRSERRVRGRADVRAVRQAGATESKGPDPAVARRRPHRRHLGDQARRQARLAAVLPQRRLRRLCLGRGRATDLGFTRDRL